MVKETFFRIDGVVKLRSLFLTIFILEMIVYFAISFIPYSNPSLVSILRSEESTTYSLGLVGMIFSIFPHNLLIASVEFIPVIGQIMFAFSAVETPLVLAATASSLGVPGIVTFLSLLLIPDTIIELPSYAAATATSIYLLYSLTKGMAFLGSKARKIVYMYLFVVLELFIAGTLESLAIEFGITQPSPENVTYPFLLWIPAIPLIYMLIRLFRRINRDEYAKNRVNAPETFDFL